MPTSSLKLRARYWSLATSLGLWFCAFPGFAAPRMLEERILHLGLLHQPEWDVFQGQTPLDPHWELLFTAPSNPTEQSLFLFQDDVKLDWRLELNGRRLGSLFLMETPLISTFKIPAGTLKDGPSANVLRLIPPTAVDDIRVGRVVLDDRPLEEILSRTRLEIEVLDSETHSSLPARLTITDKQGVLVPLSVVADASLAVRPGVVYTGRGHATLHLRPGSYTVHATRGFEYSLASENVILREGDRATLRLMLRREVDTSGWIASDTHTHTFTYSRHGDASVEERVVTLAGEGIELPIATDHNLLTDYASVAENLGLTNWFTPVIGDEVTTRQAHFNVFPVVLGSRVPDFRIQAWPNLLTNIRETPGVQVIILNHPRNVHNQFQPFASTNFNPVTGQVLQFLDFGFDAMEIINSSALQSDLMLVFHGWFAALNAGHRITGVGSSDVHDVSRYIVGQGRTYIRAQDDQPARLDVDEACRNLKDGRALISMGLLTDMTVNNRFQVGDLAGELPEEMIVKVTIQGPAWTTADRVELFANGIKLREQSISHEDQTRYAHEHPGIKAHLLFRLPRPAQDMFLVALATGPGVTEPYWAISKPYQPSSTVWTPRVAGATNPIWIDGDGDGQFTSARGYAESLVKKFGINPANWLVELQTFDRAVAAQVAGLCHQAGTDLRSPEITTALRQAPDTVRQGFADYLQTIQ